MPRGSTPNAQAQAARGGESIRRELKGKKNHPKKKLGKPKKCY
jgi:hypothetical protein